MTRVNLGIHGRDGALNDTLARIHNVTVIDGSGAASSVATRVEGIVEAAIKPLRAGKAPARTTVLDLIAHAHDGVLQFGAWSIDAQETSGKELNRRWESSKVKPAAIRLLGCSTALSSAGQAAIRHLGAAFRGVDIYGSTGLLKASNYDSDGFTAASTAALLAKNGALPDPQDSTSEANAERQFRMMDPTPPIPNIIERLRPETLDEATYDVRATMPQYRWRLSQFAPGEQLELYRQLHPELATALGLLAVPEFEALFPADSPLAGPRFHRATILLGGWFVRIYPIGFPAGVILRAQHVLKLDGGTPVHVPSATPALVTTEKT